MMVLLATTVSMAVISGAKFAYPNGIRPVSYTHLDVYKRQSQGAPCGSKTALIHFKGDLL